MIRVNAQANAKRMLANQATRIGLIGDDTYYCLDSKVWRVSPGASGLTVAFRSDDPIENELLKRLCREVSHVS
jgi:hypothetical protein